jgi:hypothetical protein
MEKICKDALYDNESEFGNTNTEPFNDYIIRSLSHINRIMAKL